MCGTLRFWLAEAEKHSSVGGCLSPSCLGTECGLMCRWGISLTTGVTWLWSDTLPHFFKVKKFTWGLFCNLSSRAAAQYLNSRTVAEIYASGRQTRFWDVWFFFRERLRTARDGPCWMGFTRCLGNLMETRLKIRE